ncbi:MAG: hypothetical protein ABSA83_02330 [Verrucomicrobiota bacterium]|jgi:hypothetical protein
MKYSVNENEGLEATASSSTVPNGTRVSHSAAQTPAALKISWHVAPAQTVAILDLTDQAGRLGLAAVIPGHSTLQDMNCL